jgi:uncharacterized protein
MIVVADTSVIINLCCIQHDYLLRELFKRVLVPVPVAEEFMRLAKTHARFANVVLPGWVEILATPTVVPDEVIQADLDPGESAAIAFCLEQQTDALLMDESLGRSVAARLGLRTFGVLRVLLEARNRTLIPSVKNVLDRLEKESGFWIAPALRNRVITLAGE